MHKGENYQDFLKWGEVFLGHSFIIIKWAWGIFCPILKIWLPPTIRIRHKRGRSVYETILYFITRFVRFTLYSPDFLRSSIASCVV